MFTSRQVAFFFFLSILGYRNKYFPRPKVVQLFQIVEEESGEETIYPCTPLYTFTGIFITYIGVYIHY